MINPPKRSYNFNTGLGCFTNSSSTAVCDSHSATLYSPMTTAIAGRQVNTNHLTTRPSSLPAYSGGINDGAPFVDREVDAIDTTLDLFCRRTGGISSPFSIGGPSSPLGLLISQTELNYCDARSTSTLATPPAAYGQDLPDEHQDSLDATVGPLSQNSLPLDVNIPTGRNSLSSTSSTQVTTNASTNPVLHTQINTDHLSEKNVTRTDVVPTSSAATLLSTSTTNNSSTDNSNREPAKTLTAHFPDLCARPDGTSFCLDLTKRFLLPATVGAKPWDRHLHLTDVIVMLVNQTGRIVYHKCHFSGASPLPQDPLHYFHHKSWDDFVHPTYADLWSRHQTKALEEARLVHPNNVVSSSDGLSHPDIPTSSAGGVEEDASVRILDCPDYRVQFGNQSFSVHTFSLPASRELPRGVATWTSVHVDGAAGENGSPDIFVVHYHRLYRESPPLEVSVGFAQSTGDSLSIRTTLPMATSAGSRLEMRESILVSPSLSCTSTVDGIDDLDEHLPTTTYVYHHHQRHDVDHHPAGAHAQHHQHSGVNKDLFDSRGPTVTYHHHHHAHHHHHHHLPQTPISASNNVSPPICSPVKPMTLASGSIHNAVSFPEPATVINLDSLDQNVNHAHCHNHPHYHRHHQGHGLGPHHHHHHHHHIRHHSVTHNHVNTPVNKENTILTMTNGGETVSKKTTTSVPTTSTRDLKRVMHLSNSKEHNGPAEQNELYSAQAGGAQSMFGSVDRHRANTADSSVGSPFQTGQPTCLVATREPQSDRSRTGQVHPATPPPPRCSPSSTGKFTISLPTTSPASSVHKKEHGERVMQLQHLLPPEAIQKIRQIWKDIFGAGATRSDDRSLLSLGSISSGPASRVQPGGALREHFARRVRQIVRQYLGPNALVTAKQTRTTTANVSVTVPEAPTEETKPADLFFGPNGRDENVASSGSTVTAPRLSTTPTETTSLSNDNTSGGHLPTVPVTGGSNATSTAHPVTPTSQGLQTIVVQSSVGFDESQDSKTQETKIPLVTSTCTTTVANVTSPPVVDFKSTSNLSSESRQAYSQLPPSGGPQAPPNMCVTDLQAARRASGNSKCCMLEWLLSEEADLDLLPASFYDAKPGPSSISVATAPSVKPTETGSSALTTANHSVVTANNTGVLPHYSSPFTSYLPPSSVGSASSCDSTSKQPLSIQLPTTISTPTTFCQSVLVSPVTPASLGSDSSRPLLGSPTTTITYPPCPNRDLDQSGPASQLTPNRHTNSVESSPTSSSVAASRSNSLLVRLLDPSTPNSVGLGKPRSNSLTISEPGSPSVIPGHLESLARRPSEGGLNHQLIVNNRTREMAVHPSSRLTSPILETSGAMSSPATASLEPVGRNKRRRSGPPTPQLAAPNSMHTSNHITRTRHVSQIDMPTNSIPVSNGPVSSLTQLLLQDFPSTNNSDSSDYDGNKTYGTTSSTTSPSYFHQSTFDSQTPQLVELGRMAPVSQASSNGLVPVSGNLHYNASTPRPKCPPDLASSIAGDLTPSSTAAHPKSSFPFFAPSGTNGPRVHSPPVYTLPTSGNSVTLSSASYQSQLTDNSCSTPLPITSSIPFTPTIAPTTEAPSSLCRLLLDPQLGPQNPSPESSIPSGTVLSTPKSSVTRGRTVYSSAARSLSSSSPKVTSHDVYEFSTASSESKGSPHSKSTESLSDSVFLETVNPASVSTSHLRPINIDTSYRQSTTTTTACSTTSQPLSPKAIAEEVEFLNEILRRDELERSSAGDHLDSAYSPKLKRSRLDNSTRRFSGEPHPHVDGDQPFMNGDSDDESVEAVARICEQLQEGFVSKPMTSELNGNTISSTFSNYSQVIGPNRMPSSLTFDSSPSNQSLRTVTSLEQLDSLTSPRSSSTISWSASSVQAPVRPAGGSHRVNKAAVAAALASQEAAASQRTKLANQRHLAEQRKRLLQHQLFNQVTVYSPTPPSNGVSSPTIIPPPALISPGLRSPPLKCIKQMRPNPTSDLDGRRIVRRRSGSHQSTPRVTSTTVFGQPSSPTTPVTFNLTATTVVVLTPPTITTTSPGADYYRNCPPEQLSRYLKEVGPNVRVQLSAPISTNGEFLTPLSPPNTQKHGSQSIWPTSSSPSVQATQSIETAQPFGPHATWSGCISGTSTVNRPIPSIISPTTTEHDRWFQAHPAPSLSPVAISPVRMKSHGRSKGPGGERTNTGRTSRVNFRRASVASCPSSTSVDLTQEPSMMLSGPIETRLVPGLAQSSLRPHSSEASQQPGSTFLIASPLYSPNPSYPATMSTVGADRYVPPTSPQLANSSSSTNITNPAQVRWTDGTVPRDISLTPQQQPRISSLPTTPTKYVVGYVPTTLSVITVSPTSGHTPPAQPSPHYLNNTTTSTHAPSTASSDQVTNAFFLYPSPEQSSKESAPRPTGTNFIYPSQEPSQPIVLQPPIQPQFPQSTYSAATPVLSRSTVHARPLPSSVVGELQHPGVDPIMSHRTHKLSRAAEQTSFSESYVIVEPQVNAGNCVPMDTKLEDSLLPEDIINDVFDLETMVVAKQQQQQQLSAKDCGLRNNCSYSTYSPNLLELDAPRDLNTYPSTASSSPSPCSPRLSNTIPPDSRSYLSP